MDIWSWVSVEKFPRKMLEEIWKMCYINNVGPHITWRWACGLVLSTPYVPVVYSSATNHSTTVVYNKDMYLFSSQIWELNKLMRKFLLWVSWALAVQCYLEMESSFFCSRAWAGQSETAGAQTGGTSFCILVVSLCRLSAWLTRDSQAPWMVGEGSKSECSKISQQKLCGLF